MKRLFTVLALFCMTISAFSNGNPSANFGGSTKGVTQQSDYLQGDANDDGVVDVSDVQAMVSSILGLTQINIENADINSDGVVNVLDVVKVVDIICAPQGYAYVDLGLSSGLKWATCNIGASSPEEYGNYYAWGETEPKSTYTSGNSITYGVEMEDISGNPQYDAATANWGSTWRMPTEEECEELVDECTWQWTTQNGVYGRKVTGPNGNHIFLPAAGYRRGSSLDFAGEHGRYWSSTPRSDDYSAYRLYLNSSYYGVDYYGYRYGGRSVRPVTE